MTDKGIRLGGRNFRAVGESTFEHDVWCMGEVKKAGLDQLAVQEGEPPRTYALRLLTSLMASGSACNLIGGLIVPAEMKPEEWSSDVAQDTSQFLAKLTDPDDKTQMQQLLLAILIPFLESGLAPLKVSGTYSGPEKPDPSMYASPIVETFSGNGET